MTESPDEPRRLGQLMQGHPENVRQLAIETALYRRQVRNEVRKTLGYCAAFVGSAVLAGYRILEHPTIQHHVVPDKLGIIGIVGAGLSAYKVREHMILNRLYRKDLSEKEQRWQSAKSQASET